MVMSSDGNHALITPGRVMGDFRTWLERNASRLQLSPEQVDWYARTMTTAQEFGWQCKGDMLAAGFRFTWINKFGSEVSGATEADVYAAFLSSLQARHRFLKGQS